MAGRPGFWERVYVVVTLFFLTYGLPPLWLRSSSASEEYAGGGALDLVMFTGLLGLSVAILAVTGPGLARVLQLDGALLALLALLLLSSQWSYDPGLSMRRSAALLMATAFAYYVFRRFSVSEIIAFTGTALAVGTVLNYAWIFGLPQFGDSDLGWTGLLSHKNSLGRVTALGTVTHLLLVRIRPGARSWHLALAAANVPLVLGSQSTTAAVSTASLVALLMVYVTFRARRTLFAAVLVALSTTAIVGALVATDQLKAITDALGKDITLTGRTPLWSESLNAFAERPLLGYGYEGFWGGWWTPAHEIWRATGWSPPHSHNALIEMLLIGGVVGAALLVFLTVRSLVRGIVFLRTVPGAVGLWPLTYLSFVVLVSITERGIISRSLYWVLFVVAVLAVADNRQRLVAVRADRSEAPVGGEQGRHTVLPRQFTS